MIKTIFFLLLLSLSLISCGGVVKEYTAAPELYLNPHKYFGKRISDVSALLGVKPNEGGNIVVDTPHHHFLFEHNHGYVSYMDVRFLESRTFDQSRDFKSKPFLKTLAVNVESLDFARKQTHFHTYYDHKERIKLGFSCMYDGAHLSVGFSKKYYGQ